MATEKSVMMVIRATRPSFRNNHDKLAFAVHASFLASDYILTAVGNQACSDSALSSSNDEVGIEGWNEVDGEYAFVYANAEKDHKKVLVKCLVMNENLLIHALADGISEPLHFEINVEEYVGNDGNGNYNTQFKNLDKLVKGLDSKILSKLGGPSQTKINLRSSETREEPQACIIEPGGIVSDHPGAQIHPSGVVVPPIPPFGGSDLFPGPGAGMYPQRGDFGGGSMLVGPNDPRWFGVGPDLGRGAPPGVPPGARFDPYGPPGVPGFEPNRFMRGRGRGPGRGGGIHPDLEHFGNDSDFI